MPMIMRAEPPSDTRAFGFSRIARWTPALPRLSKLSVTSWQPPRAATSSPGCCA